MSEAVERARPRAAVAAALGLLAAAVPVVAVTAPSADELADPLTLVLAACAIVSVLFASDWEGAVDISSAFVCFMLAVAFVGPVAAFAIPVAAEVVTFAVRRYRVQALAVNLAATAIPSLLAALVYGELVGTLREGRPGDLGVLALVAIGFLVLNYMTISALVVLLDGGSMRTALRPPRELLPSLALTVALTVSIAGVFAQLGLAAGAFLVLIIVAFTYMSRLVVIARERTE